MKIKFNYSYQWNYGDGNYVDSKYMYDYCDDGGDGDHGDHGDHQKVKLYFNK